MNNKNQAGQQDLSNHEDFEVKMYQNFSSMSEAEQRAMYDKTEVLLSQKKSSQAEDPTVEEAFISIEGILNGEFYEAWDEFEELETEPVQATLEYYIDEGVKKVNATEYGNVYAELYNQVSSMVDPANDEDFLMVDILIDDIDEEDQEIFITGNALIANAATPSLWYTPGGACYAAQKAEWCNGTPNVGGSFDAANFLMGYANGTAAWRDWTANQCGNGINIAFPPLHGYVTWNEGNNYPLYQTDPNTGNNTWNQVINHYWKDDDNSCIGDNNDSETNNTIWYSYYDDMDFLINYGLTRINTLYPNAEFYLTNWHSHDSQVNPNPDISERFYHGGSFQYAVITCK